MTTTQPSRLPTHREPRPPRRHLKTLRYAVRGVLVLGVAASLAANMLHAQPNDYSRTIAAWPPLALFATIEVISRVPIRRATLAGIRVGATAIIGAIAAWVSYWHMQAVVAHYGEHGATAYLLPLSVDGLVVVASISLFELADRIRELDDPAAAHTETAAVNTTPAPQPTPQLPTPQPPPAEPADMDPAPTQEPRYGDAEQLRGDQPEAAPPAPHDGGGDPRPQDVATVIAELRRVQPGIGVGTLAQRVGRSKRTVQRIIKHLDQQAAQTAVNGVTRPDLIPLGDRHE